MFYNFRYWLESNNLHKLYVSLAAIIIVSIVGFFGYNKISDVVALNGRAQQIQSEAKTNAKYFTILKEYKNTQKDGTVVLTYDLFMKQPFENPSDINGQLNDFYKTVKDKYNVQKTTVRAIGVRLYDRKEVWDKGLTPRATSMYAFDQSYAETLQAKDDKQKQAEQAKIGLKQDSNTSYLTTGSVSSQNSAWQQTINNGGSIDYSKYALSTNGLLAYDPKAVNNPLSDQEFSFWLKMRMYEAIIGNNNVQAAAQLYLAYDLNGQVGYQNFITIAKDFQDFDKRETALGDGTNYFPNSVLLKQQLAIYRPQLLFYVLSNGQMLSSYQEAQKQLIKSDPSTYSSVIQQHLEDSAKNVDKYGDVNYYQKKDSSGKFVNSDPFAATTGAYSKKYPEFVRPQFSPTPIENNAFFGKATAVGVSGAQQ